MYMQYYKKRLDIMELRVQIVRGLEVTWQFMKAIYEILHVKYHIAPFLDRCIF